jgi:hypothetical protein
MEVGEPFVHYYRGLLGEDVSCEPISINVLNMGPKVPLKAMSDLCKPVTQEEVHEVIFNMGNNKAHGPDSYSALFFKKAWSIVGEDISKAIMEFFKNGSLLKQLNHALIALIPKGSHASSVSDYRPYPVVMLYTKLSPRS